MTKRATDPERAGAPKTARRRTYARVSTEAIFGMTADAAADVLTRQSDSAVPECSSTRSRGFSKSPPRSCVPEPSPFLTARCSRAAVVAFVQAKRRLAYEMVGQGKLPHVRPGRAVRVPRQALGAWERDKHPRCARNASTANVMGLTTMTSWNGWTTSENAPNERTKS